MDWRYDTEYYSYLIGLDFKYKLFTSFYTAQNFLWDHEHCEFCWQTITDQYNADNCNDKKIGIDYDTGGYVSTDDRHWICEACFDELKNAYDWKTQSEN
jgi:hypothetical protein